MKVLVSSLRKVNSEVDEQRLCARELTCNVLYFIVLYFIVMYCISLYCISL